MSLDQYIRLKKTKKKELSDTIVTNREENLAWGKTNCKKEIDSLGYSCGSHLFVFWREEKKREILL